MIVYCINYCFYREIFISMFTIISFSVVIFFILLSFIKISANNNDSSINILTNKFFNNIYLIFRSTTDLLYSVFNSFLKIYELVGESLKRLIEIFRSINSSTIKFLDLLKILALTFFSLISLCRELLKETKRINPVNSMEIIFSNCKLARNNIFNLFIKKENDTKEVALIKK